MKRLDIESELLELGAPAGRQGYIQMVTALEFIMQHDDVMCAAANLYPYVAERLNTVRHQVKQVQHLERRKLHLGISSRGICVDGC